MAKDIGINENLDIFIDDRNDLGFVSGREEAEQSIAMKVSLFFHEEIGSIDEPNVPERLRLHTRRVIESHDQLEGVESVVVEQQGEEANVLEVRIMYDVTDDYTFEVSG